MNLFHYYAGTLPIVISIPHAGTFVPEFILERFAPSARQLPDTDWHVEELYTFARELGLHVLIATHSRYVVDLNRSSDGQSLYPGKFTTGLCPLTLFDGSPIYQKGMEPDDKEIQERIQAYWQPYHNKLQAILDELKNHDRVIVFDAHSIRSQVPLLFEGALPDLNLGSADGKSMDQQLTDKLIACCKNSSYSFVHNGRFKGGYITRHYGKPEQGIHAVQLELTQHNYMQETHPFTYDANKAKKLQITLQKLLSSLLD